MRVADLVFIMRGLKVCGKKKKRRANNVVCVLRTNVHYGHSIEMVKRKIRRGDKNKRVR